jgi:asparagine N-glycosylation enzyme membrane subunit Stt3
MNNSHLLYVLVDMQTLKPSKRVQPLDRRPRRVPSWGALAAILFGVVVLAAFGHIIAFLLFLLAGIAVLTAVLRRRRSGR